MGGPMKMFLDAFPFVRAVLADVSARRGWSYAHAARVYSPRHTGVRAAQRRPWVAELSLTMRTPPSFPRSLWPVYRPRWERLLELARRAIAGELPHRCDVVAHVMEAA